MDPEIGPVRSQLLGHDGEVHGLQRRVRGRAVCDCDEGVQCPNERKPIFFMREIY
jgi:hypothetical protein